jgi:hypothetical protein
MALPFPDLGPAIEPYAISTTQVECDPEPKPGVVTWRAWVLNHVGGGDLGISRACEVGGASDHKLGRAWDWAVRADDPADAERVRMLLDWLLATDRYGNAHAMYRALGMTFVIWDGQVFSSRSLGWAPYAGKSPHRDHVHFSFGEDGALGKTSFFGAPSEAATAVAKRGSPPAWGALLLALGAVAGWSLVRALAKKVDGTKSGR